MHAWEDKVKDNQPKWIVVRPAVDEESTGGQKYLPLPDGSFLAQGYAPTKHTVRMKVKTDVQNITAFRLELLNDPNLPLGGPGRSIKGTAALTEFKVRSQPADNPGKVEWVKFVKATADVNPPEKPLDAIYDDKSGKQRVTGPVSFAIDGKDETAWGTDLDPGRRNQPRKAVFLADKPIAFAKGTLLTFHLTQNHGGWNSDDNQNHNLGRFRLSITTQPGAEADPLAAARARHPRRRRAIDADAGAGSGPSSATGARPCRSGRTPTTRSRRCGRSTPKARRSWCCKRATQPRDTHVLKRGDFLKPAQSVTPGVPAFLHPLPAERRPIA